MEPEAAQHQVTVVLVQYDRKKYAGALERLLAVLGALQNISFRVLVMDNADPRIIFYASAGCMLLALLTYVETRRQAK